MTDNEKKSLAFNLKQRAVAQGLSYAKLGTMLNISAALISQILNGNHDNISDKVWNTLTAWLDLRPDEIAPSHSLGDASFFNPETNEIKWVIEPTDNFKAIQKRCEEAQLQCRFRAISGFTGAGKTTAIKHFAKNRENAFYLLCTQSMNSKDFVSSLLRAIGIGFDGTLFRSMQALKDRLLALDKPILLLDDAGKLNDRCLRLLQEIIDSTEFHAAVIVAGTDEELKDRIFKSASRNKPGFKQLKSRINDWQPMNPPKHLFIERICKYYGIIDEGAVNYVCHLARDYRALRNLITNAARVANGAITLANLQTVGERNQIAS